MVLFRKDFLNMGERERERKEPTMKEEGLICPFCSIVLPVPVPKPPYTKTS